MRIHLVYALLVGDADKLEHIQRSLLDLFLGHFGVVQDGDLIDLIADPENRVEGGHWLLEDHGDHVSADLLHLCRRGVDDVKCRAVVLIEADLTADRLAGRALEQLHQGKARNGLAAAGLADDSDRGALRDIEADAIDGLDRTDVAEEVGADVVKLDDVVLVAHFGGIQGRILIGVGTLRFELLGDPAVEPGDISRLLAGNIGRFLFLVSHIPNLLSASTWDRRRHADRRRRS